MELTPEVVQLAQSLVRYRGQVTPDDMHSWEIDRAQLGLTPQQGYEVMQALGLLPHTQPAVVHHHHYYGPVQVNHYAAAPAVDAPAFIPNIY